MPPCPINNERRVEIPWLLNNLGSPHHILDVGAADADYVPELLATGAEVTLQDVRPFIPRHIAPAQRFAMYVGSPPWPEAWAGAFDLVTCISVLDHVGLDAYGQPEDGAALPALIAEMRRVLVPGGRVLLTVPVGRDLYTTHPGGGQRVFSRDALYHLFEDWHIRTISRYRLIGERYTPVMGWASVDDAGYLVWRAEAVACLEVTA